MPTESYKLSIFPGRKTTVKVDSPDSVPPRHWVILGHGQINNLDFPLLARTAEYLALHGCAAVRYNFLYAEAGQDKTDSNDVLLACLSRVVGDAASRFGIPPERMIVGGKSLGARVAAQAVCQGLDAAGLVYLGFPLVSPSKPGQSREVMIMNAGKRPQLFFAGSRDPLCPLDKLRAALGRVPGPCRLHVIEGGDHSFVLPEGAAKTEEEVHQDIARRLLLWLEEEFN